jgi:hypothetical protein
MPPAIRPRVSSIPVGPGPIRFDATSATSLCIAITSVTEFDRFEQKESTVREPFAQSVLEAQSGNNVGVTDRATPGWPADTFFTGASDTVELSPRRCVILGVRRPTELHIARQGFNP